MKHTDPKKKKPIVDRSQQLSDKAASMVSGGMPRKQAEAYDRKQDAKAQAITSVQVKTRGSSQNLPSKSKTKKAEHYLDNFGRMANK
jgi:hypothetical protein